MINPSQAHSNRTPLVVDFTNIFRRYLSDPRAFERKGASDGSRSSCHGTKLSYRCCGRPFRFCMYHHYIHGRLNCSTKCFQSRSELFAGQSHGKPPSTRTPPLVDLPHFQSRRAYVHTQRHLPGLLKLGPRSRGRDDPSSRRDYTAAAGGGIVGSSNASRRLFGPGIGEPESGANGCDNMNRKQGFQQGFGESGGIGSSQMSARYPPLEHIQNPPQPDPKVRPPGKCNR